MDKNILIQVAFFVVCFSLGVCGIKVAKKFMRSRVPRAIVVALVRGLFYTPTIIITTGVALVPSIFALIALQWPFLVPAGIVFVVSIYTSLRRGTSNFETVY